jgi:hypothetical protein
MPALDSSILEAALMGLQAQRSKLDEYISAIQRMLRQGRRGRPPQTDRTTAELSRKPRKRRLTAAGRKRIAEAARQRWAALRAEQVGAAAPARGKKAATRKQRRAFPAVTSTPAKKRAAKKAAKTAARKQARPSVKKAPAAEEAAIGSS